LAHSVLLNKARALTQKKKLLQDIVQTLADMGCCKATEEEEHTEKKNM